MQALSKTAAIREASSAVSIHGRGTSWTIICPHGEIDGPSTELHACSYSEARAKAACAKASLAMQLMGLRTLDTDAEIYCSDDTDTRRLVAAGLKAARV